MIANASSSSVSGRRFEVPLEGRLSSLTAAFVGGGESDLLAPLRFLPPGTLPNGPSLGVDRSDLARALGEANDAYGHPRAEPLAEKLADPETRVVVTGQQPGLFGGPLMALSKMVAAVRFAEALEASGEKAVAVFWVATEDHDWAESSRFTLPSPRGPETSDLGEDPAPLLPMGMRTFGEDLEAASERLAEVLRGEEAVGRLEKALDWYRPDTRFGEAFCRLMVGILGERAPLFLDSMLPGVKRAQAPHLARLVRERVAVDEAFAAADAAIQARGHGLQVQPQPGVSPLFLLHGRERRRIEWRGSDRYALRGLDDFEAPVEQLLETLTENPSVVSPGVLARPAIQDAILGTYLQVMGPAEVAYMAQVRAIYPLLGLEGASGHGPWTTLRPQAMVLDSRQTGYLEELDVPLVDLLEQPVEKIIADRLGRDFVGPARERIEALLEGLVEPSLKLDPGLEKSLKKTRDQMARGLDTYAAKVASAVARKNDVWLRRFEQLKLSVLPGGHFQERELSTLFFWGRYGQDLPKAMLEQIDLDPRRLSVIRIGGAS